MRERSDAGRSFQQSQADGAAPSLVVDRPAEGDYVENDGGLGLQRPEHTPLEVFARRRVHDWRIVLDSNQIAEHIRERLAGRRAMSLAPPVTPGTESIATVLRALGAYWMTLLFSALFILGFVLALQGAAQLLPRQIYLRVSSWLQMGCFALFLTVYFFQLPFAAPDTLVDNTGPLGWLPSYCFFAIFQQLNGALPVMLDAMAHRAWAGLAIVLTGAAMSYLICYLRTLRMIAEQPDIQPAVRRLGWLPRFGTALETAVGQFCLRTLFRSRQHRMILSFYLGIALGLPIFFSSRSMLRDRSTTSDVSAMWIIPSVLIVCGAVIGTRVVFSMPLELKANWIFRLVASPDVAECVAATRRALYVIAVLPVWTPLAILFFCFWPWRLAAGHLLVLALVANIVAELMLFGFHKIPFTCSYLPGKSHFHMAVIGFLGLVFLAVKGYRIEWHALHGVRPFLLLVLVLLAAVIAARWRTGQRIRRETSVQFEEEEEPAIFELGLHRDGHLAVD